MKGMKEQISSPTIFSLYCISLPQLLQLLVVTAYGKLFGHFSGKDHVLSRERFCTFQEAKQGWGEGVAEIHATPWTGRQPA